MGLLDSLSGVAATVPGLQQLKLHDVRQGKSYGQVPPHLGQTVRQLQQLTRLQIHLMRLSVQDVQHICCLPKLGDLNLYNRYCITLSTTTTPNISKLTALESLELHSMSLRLDVLAPCMRLRKLVLDSMYINSGISPWNPDDLLSGDGVEHSHCAELLELLPRMTRLQRLVLKHLHRPIWPAPSSAYSAMAASGCLQHLEVWHCRLPEGVWEFIVPAHMQLPQLQELASMGYPEFDEDDGREIAPAAHWSSTEVARLVAC